MRIRRKKVVKKVVASGRLSVLFIEDKTIGKWSAQCLEHDIAVQGKTLEDVNLEMQRVIACHLSVSRNLKRKPFEGLNKAPKVFFDLYERSQMRFNQQPIGASKTKSYPRVAELQAVG